MEGKRCHLGSPATHLSAVPEERGPVRVSGMDSESAHPNCNGTQMLALYEMDISKSDTPL